MNMDSNHNDLSDSVNQDPCFVIEPEGLPQDTFKGPEFRALRQQNKKRNKLNHLINVPPELSQYIACTSCQQQINPFVNNAVKEHPILRVILCKSCYEYYHSGEFEQDENGIDNYCRWCGDGGTVTVCESCSYVFCKSCIRRHVSRNEFSRIKEETWLCFVCNPAQIKNLMDECRQVLQALNETKEHQTKKKTNTSKSKSNKSSKRKMIIKDEPLSPDSEGDSSGTRQSADLNASISDKQSSRNVVHENGISSPAVPSTSNKAASERLSSVNTWKADFAQKIDDVVISLQALSKDFQARFESDSEQNGPNHSATTFQKNYRYSKVKTLKSFKSSLRKVSMEFSRLEKKVDSSVAKYRTLYGEKYSDFDASDSTTAKESDSEDSALMTPSKKKMLRKRKVHDARLSSSNENETPIKLQRRESLFTTNIDDNETAGHFAPKMEGIVIKTERRSSHELSDTGSSKLFRRKARETLDSISSVSDIFEQENDTPTKAKKKLAFPNSIDDSDKSNSVLTKCSVSLSDISKQKDAKKNDLDFRSSGNELSSDDQASDDQILPEMDAEEEQGIHSNSPDSNLAAEKNKIALENLKNQQLLAEEEESGEDSDVNELLQKDEKKPAATPSKAASDKEDNEEKSDDSENDPLIEMKKKSKYLNPLLKVRIDSSDNEKETKTESHSKKRRHSNETSDDSGKRTKPTLNCDEALNDPNLSDEDVLLLQGKDDEVVAGDIEQSDVDVLLSENEKATKKSDKAATSEKMDKNDSNKDDTSDNTDDSAAIDVVKLKSKEKPQAKEKEKSSEEEDKEDDTTDSDAPLVRNTNNAKKKQSSIRQFFKSGDLSSGDEFKESKSRSSAAAKRKHRRVVISDSDDEDELIEINNSSSADEDEDSRCVEVGKSSRRNIRKIIDDENISQDTKTAEKIEMERRERLRTNVNDNEVIVIDDESSPVKKVAAKLILSKKPLVQIDPFVVKVLKDHQIGGIQFLWDNIIETVSRANTSKGDGCILAHCMGLGKTLQVVAFLHAVLTSTELPTLSSALVICPLGTVSNWVVEFRKWLRKCKKQLRVIEFEKTNHEGAVQLKQWQRRGGVAVMSYSKYRNICMGKSSKISSRYLEMFKSSLQDPGPDIVVCDEGHVLKNEKTNLSVVMEKIKTKRRIVLTGTPLQNNLLEYHCMVSFVKPRLLGNKKEFSNRFVNPILNGQHVDSTKLDVHIMKKRSHVLHELLAGCVQRKDVDCLRLYLTPKHEYVLLVRLSPLQIRLYEHYLKNFNCADVQSRKGNLFQDFNNFLLISSHPRMLLLSKARHAQQDRVKEAQADLRRFVVEEDDEEEEESESATEEETAKNKPEAKDIPTVESLEKMSISELKKVIKDNGGDLNNCINKTDLIEKAKTALNLNEEEGDEKKSWFDDLFPTQDELIKAVEHSGKMLLFLEILRLATAVGDKVVVFSQSLLTLDLIEIILGEISQQPSSSSIWRRDYDYFRIDGSICSKKRKMHIDRFNSKTNIRARLFLISTRAGGIGINLVGANRAVLFDASWNPTHDVQSIYRIYRFGQEKPCYVYRLIAQGTMEEKIYERQVVKQSLAFRVVDEQQIERHFTANDIAELYTFKPKPLVKKSSEEDTPEQAPPTDRLLADLLREGTTRDSIVSYHQHDSLLDHKVDEELTEEERRVAWDEYDREKNPIVQENDPITRLPLISLKKLIDSTKEELERNSALLETCKEIPLSDIMLSLKIKNRNMQWEKLLQAAIEVLKLRTQLKARLENTRRILNLKLKQVLHCHQIKVHAAASTSAAHAAAVAAAAAGQKKPSTSGHTQTTGRSAAATTNPTPASHSNRPPFMNSGGPHMPRNFNFAFHHQPAAARFPGYNINVPNGASRNSARPF